MVIWLLHIRQYYGSYDSGGHGQFLPLPLCHYFTLLLCELGDGVGVYLSCQNE